VADFKIQGWHAPAAMPGPELDIPQA